MIKNWPYFLFLLCVGTWDLNLYSQSLVGASGNGNIFVKVTYLGDTIQSVTQTLNYGVKQNTQVPVKQFFIECLQLEKKRILSQINFNVRKEGFPDSLHVSPKGDNFYIKFKNHYFVFNSFSGKLIGDYIYPSVRALYSLSKRKGYNEKIHLSQKVVAFPEFDNLFVVRYLAMLVYYDSRTGNPVDTCTGFSRNALFTQLYFTEGDQYLYAQDNNQRSYIWKVGQRKILIRHQADQLVFSSDSKFLFALRKLDKNFKLITYSLKSGEPESVFRKANVLKYYPPPVVSSGRIVTYFPQKSPSLRFATLSPNGKFLLVGFGYDRLSDYYMVINTRTFELVSHFDELRMGKGDRNLNWISDNVLEIVESQFSSRLIKISYENLPKYRNYKLKSEQVHEELALAKRKLDRISILSASKKFMAYPIQDRFTSSVVFMDTEKKGDNTVSLFGYSFVRYTDDGNYAVLIGPKSIPFKINVREIFSKRGDISPDYLTEFSWQGASKVTEKWIQKDSRPPIGYAYHRLDTVVPISKVLPETRLNLVQKTVLYEDTILSMQVHLLDDFGNFYSEAGSIELEGFWCGLFVERPDSIIEEIEGYEVLGYTNGFNSRDAVALVLDHSGSMGEQRSFDIQLGAKEFIKMKSEEDGIALVKYDHSVGIESYLSSDQTKLLDSLKLYGMLGYGGNTALLDGINTGISILKNENGYNRKAVVLMTDGMENSSNIDEREVLQRALQNNIAIFTIGFGHMTNDLYLESISQLTGGSFYKIYKTSDLTWIFEDIYRRMNNFYEIRFKLTSIGVHRFILKICYENAKPLIVEYDNTPLPPLEYIDTAVYTLKPPVTVRVYDSVIIDQPEFENIAMSLPPLPFEHINKMPEFDTLELITEFEYLELPNIKFEFDKTVIIPGTDRGIENIVGFLNKYPLVQIEVIGHTDSLGSYAYNIGLSLRRAKKVKNLLVVNGIDPQRIKISGMGESQPALKNDNFWRRTYNRRVEFRLEFPAFNEKSRE